MTVKELKEKLATLPDDMDIYVAPRKTEFAYGLINSVYVREITFSEDPDDSPLAEDTVVVIDEE